MLQPDGLLGTEMSAVLLIGCLLRSKENVWKKSQKQGLSIYHVLFRRARKSIVKEVIQSPKGTLALLNGFFIGSLSCKQGSGPKGG